MQCACTASSWSHLGGHVVDMRHAFRAEYRRSKLDVPAFIAHHYNGHHSPAGNFTSAADPVAQTAQLKELTEAKEGLEKRLARLLHADAPAPARKLTPGQLCELLPAG